jgi:uncharacterized iron-regulated membrane protein
MTRRFWLLLHRYAGLTMALFLIVAGLTGSVIAFQRELDVWLNPELFSAPGQGEALPPSELAARVERAEPSVRVTAMPLQIAAGESALLSVEPRVDPTTGKPFEFAYDELFADPVTGDILGMRHWGACCFARAQVIPFLYQLHYSLHLPGNWGLWVMGGVALLGVFDCFVGAYLTFPRSRPFFAKWRPAWRVKTAAGAYRINFDLHRAGGLWSWALLLMLAVSGVYFNLYDEVFRPVFSFFFSLTPTMFEQRADQPSMASSEPALSFDEVSARAKEEAVKRGWQSVPASVFYRTNYGIYSVYFRPPHHDHSAGLGDPVLHFDGSDGHLLGERVPGQGTVGDVVLQLQFPLHSGQIAGLPGRIIICVTGLVVAMLSCTGVVIWLHKWRKVGGRSLAKS